MSIDVTHWIRGYLYDSDGNAVSGATVTASTVTGVETNTVTATTTATGYYQLNIQDVCSENDLIKISFTSGSDIIEEFIRVDLDDLTQEVNATFEEQFKITTDSFTFYLPFIRWDSVNGDTNKNIQVFNFRDGSLDTVDRDINSEPFVISGWVRVGVYNRQTISGKIEAIIHLQNESEEITIHDVNTNLNGTYVIKKFTFTTIRGSPNLFEWKMQLEYAGD